MKPYISFFLVFAFLVMSAQKKDTIFRQPDCTKFHQAEKEKFDALENDFKNIDFSKLNKLIIDKIDEKKFKTKNIIVYVLKIRTICGNEIDFNKCLSEYNFKNNFYNENNFWNRNTIIYFRDKMKRNIIPSIFFHGFGGRNDKYFSKNLKDRIEYNFTSFKVKDFKKEELNFFGYKNEKYVFFRYGNIPININNSDKVYIDFKNFLNKIINVEIFYNDEENPQILEYQYINNQWKLIENKNGE